MEQNKSAQELEKPTRRRWVATGVVVVLLLGGGYMVLRGPPPEPSPQELWRQLAGDRPLDQVNVILVTIDTLRADHLPAYGYEGVETPHLDALVREGVRFANAATTVPFTLPAHSSIMTGTYPPYHGVRENVGYFLDESIPTTAERLREAGYDTAGFVSAFVLDSRWGIARGFDEYLDEFDLASMKQANMGSVQRDGKETVAAAVSWLDQRSNEKPFFLWLHLFDPHEPYKPPEPYRSRYPKRPYDAEIAYTDALVGEFRQALEEKGLWENSLVALTGDHGEGLGSKGEMFHGYYVYETTIHVPLIIRLPFGELGGRVVDAAVSHVDLQPTLLEVVGQPIPETAQGSSLLPLLLGIDGGGDRMVYSESYYSLFHYGWAPLRSIRTASHKYIDAPKPELYHLLDDRPESKNLFRDERRLARDLKDRLDALLETLDRPADEAPTQPDLDEATLRQLRALGYVAGRGEITAEEENSIQRADPKDKIKIHQAIMSAQSLIGKGDDDAAEEKLKKVLELDSGMLDAHQMLGDIASQQQRHEEAVGHFQRALELDSDHTTSLFGLANAYRRLGRLDEALLGFQRLETLGSRDSKAALAITDIYVEQGRLPEALTVIEEVTREDDAPALLHNKHGELLVLSGRADEAIGRFQQAITANEKLAQPRFNLAVLYEERGELDRAVELYDQTIERAPKNYKAQFNLGRIHGHRGNLDRQQELYEAALVSNPDFVRGHYLLAKLLMDHGGDLARAEELTRQALAKDPEHRSGPLGYFLLADLLNRTGRPAQARQAVETGRRIQAQGE